jgi:hypothetical protein
MHVGNSLNNGEINSKKYQLMLLVFVTILVGVDCDCADASDTGDCGVGDKKNVKHQNGSFLTFNTRHFVIRSHSACVILPVE